MTTIDSSTEATAGGAAILWVFSSIAAPSAKGSKEDAVIQLSKEDQDNDAMDPFNHPRLRRLLIWQALWKRHQQAATAIDGTGPTIRFAPLPPPESDFAALYCAVHSKGLLSFLQNAWDTWEAMKAEGRDPLGFLNHSPTAATTSSYSELQLAPPPPFVPVSIPLHREQTLTSQRPSQHVLGQAGYYCTDSGTPIFAHLRAEIQADAALIQAGVRRSLQGNSENGSDAAGSSGAVVYVIPTHPGHHAARDCFGGYCYVNHVALAARLLQQHLLPASTAAATMNTAEDATPGDRIVDNNIKNDSVNIDNAGGLPKVAILDVDYHCGNGTASIFDTDPSVLVISLHCHPDYDYPFHSGFSDQIGNGEGEGTTLHLPMMPQTTWIPTYQATLQQAMARMAEFAPHALIISLGLDTHDQDPCALRRAGFCLQGEDYVNMGTTIAAGLADCRHGTEIPVLFVQEGGYKMDQVGAAAANVVTAFVSERTAVRQQRSL